MVLLSKAQIHDLLTNPKPGSQKHFIADCPYCGKPGHFYIKHTNTEHRLGKDNTGVHDCKKCGETGSIFRFLNHIGRGDLIYRPVDITTLTKYILDFDEQEEDEPLELEVPPRKWPVGFEPIYSSKYLQGRCFTEADFAAGTIGRVRAAGPLRKYVLIGVTEGGVVKGYIGRCLSKDPELLRYRNSRGTNFAALLWGYDELTPEVTTVYLVEGLFDAKRINQELRNLGIHNARAVATFGKKVSRIQIAKLILKGITKVIVFYDNDATNTSQQYAKQLISYFPQVQLAYLAGIWDAADAPVNVLYDALRVLYGLTAFKLNALRRFKL
jgi:DNA primase